MTRPVLKPFATALLRFVLLAAVSVTAAAQDPTAADDASVGELESLASMLKDPAQRETFVARLDALVEQQRAQGDARTVADDSALATVIDRVAAPLEVLAGQAHDVIVLAIGLPDVLRGVLERGRDPATLRLWATMAGKIVLVLLAGIVARAVFERILRWPFGNALRAQPDDGALARVGRSLGIAIVTVLAVAAFAAAALALLALLEPRSITRLLATTLIYAYTAERLVSVLSARLLVPRDPTHRVIPCSDEDASYCHVWIRRFAIVAAYGYSLVTVGGLLGLPPAAHDMLARAVGLLLCGLGIVLVLQNRTRVSLWLRGEGSGGPSFGGLRRVLADTWFAFAIVYILVAWAVWSLGIDAGFHYLARATVLSLLALVVARLVARSVAGLLGGVFHIPRDIEQRFPGLERRVNRYLPLVGRTFTVLIYLAATLTILDAWGLDVSGWLATEGGLDFIARAVRIAGVLLFALLGYEALSLVIRYQLETRDVSGGRDRARTLLPLLQNGAMTVIVVVTALIVLSELGLDITPLLAGAGVFGLAIGFGAQSLVKDLITGLFILIEDAISIGDVVEAAGRVGVVESMSIRTIRMRDLEGTVHTVPFGEVTTVSNMTKDFSFALMDIGVAYRENVDDVIEVLRAVAEELRADDEFSPLILEPLEVLGLDSFGDSSVNIRIRLKTLPIKQWSVKREYQRRLKRRFDELDIEIPFPHQTLYFGVDKQGTAPPGRVEVLGREPKADSGTEPEAAS